MRGTRTRQARETENLKRYAVSSGEARTPVHTLGRIVDYLDRRRRATESNAAIDAVEP